MLIEVLAATIISICQQNWDLSKHSQYVDFKPSKTYYATVNNCDATRKKIYVPPPPPPKPQPKEVCEMVVKEVEKKATTIFFDLGSAKLKKKYKDYIDEIVANEDFEEARVEGYACELGSEKINLKLSQKRADIVTKYLESLGVEVIETKGLGECKHDENKKLNRKADVYIIHRYEEKECRLVTEDISYPAPKMKDNIAPSTTKQFDSDNELDKELEEIFKTHPELKKSFNK